MQSHKFCISHLKGPLALVMKVDLRFSFAFKTYCSMRGPHKWMNVHRVHVQSTSIHPPIHSSIPCSSLCQQGGSSVSLKAKRLEAWRDPRRRTRLSSIHFQINKLPRELHHPRKKWSWNWKEIDSWTTDSHSLRIPTSDTNKFLNLFRPIPKSQNSDYLLSYLLTCFLPSYTNSLLEKRNKFIKTEGFLWRASQRCTRWKSSSSSSSPIHRDRTE